MVDTTAPALTIPADRTIEATSPAGASVTFTATATDIVDLTRPVSCNPASGTVFPLGTTTVSCSATDKADNTATGSFNVDVVDTTAPTLTVSADITAEATSPNGAAVTFPAATATDAADTNPTVGCSPTIGDTFALGTTIVTCTAQDSANNVATESFTVDVVDTTAPDLTLPSDTFATAGPSGAIVDYTVSATDAVDTSPDIVCDPPSGNLFPLGTTTVHCSATDDEGNVSTGSFDVTVVDHGALVLRLPANQAVEATGADGAEATFDVTATDDVDPSPDITCTHSSGETFPIGDTAVRCTATDDHGNATTGGFTITVHDTSAPLIDLPGDISVEATGPDGAVVTWDVTAADAVAGTVPVTCTPLSGSLFPLGTTTVTCTASDSSPSAAGFFGNSLRAQQADPGNIATGTFTVTVTAAQTPPTTTTPTTTTLPEPTTTVAVELPATR